jgi:hypothetical protein
MGIWFIARGDTALLWQTFIIILGRILPFSLSFRACDCVSPVRRYPVQGFWVLDSGVIDLEFP